MRVASFHGYNNNFIQFLFFYVLGKHHITDFSSAGGTGLFDPYLVRLKYNLNNDTSIKRQ